jgi:hypothetical protein
MKNIGKKISLFFSFVIILGILSIKSVLAVCPLCTIAVGAGVGFSRWLGIDDSITGLWIGGLVVSLIMWTESWFDKKNIHFKWRAFITTIGYYIIVVIPLYFMGIIQPINGDAFSVLVDKLILGIVVGSAGFWFGAEWYLSIKNRNNGHANFPFQKVVMPIAPLIIFSIVFYFLTK